MTNGEVALDALWRGVALRLYQVEGRGIGRLSGGAWHWKIKWRGVALENQVEGRGIGTGLVANVRYDRSTTLYMIYCSQR